MNGDNSHLTFVRLDDLEMVEREGMENLPQEKVSYAGNQSASSEDDRSNGKLEN